MRYSIFTAITLLCVLSNVPAAVYQEEVKYYDVEILLFENLDQNTANTETWPTSLEFEAPENSLFIGSPFPGPIPPNYNPRFTFKPIKASTYQLQEEAKILNENKDYRVLYHRSWRQPGMKREEAVSVKIQRDIPRLVTTAFPEDNTIQNNQSDFTVNLPSSNKLQGLVTITLSRYLHIKTDIQYTEHVIVRNSEDETLAEVKPQVYQLKQTRKMRSKELHYLDNPKLGLLVYITPVKKAPIKQHQAK